MLVDGLKCIHVYCIALERTTPPTTTYHTKNAFKRILRVNARARVNSLALNRHNVAAQPSSRPTHPCAASASSPTPCYSSPSRPIAKLATCSVHSRPQARRRAPADSKQQALR